MTKPCWRATTTRPTRASTARQSGLADGIATAYASNSARLGIAGTNPALLKDEDPAKVSRANIAASKAMKPAMELITRHAINWSILAGATPAWAKLVFPELPESAAMPALWEAIFKASRITGDDPVADWKTHGRNIAKRVEVLNAKRFAALHFKGPGTDLTVGLADDHMWAGGGGTGSNGIFCNANIPTEECFTTPHKDRVDGFVSASKPLSHQGTLIENIQCRFEKGRIVEANATAGQDALRKLIAVDEGASHLGEVALVPHGSPLRRAACCSGTRCSTRTRPATLRWGRRTPRASATASTWTMRPLPARARTVR